MRKTICGLAVAILMAIVALPAAAQRSRASVSAAEVNGTYKMNFRGKFRTMSNDLKILALGGGKLRVAFDLIYPYTLRNGETSVNMGFLDAEIPIVGDTAIYGSSEYGDCKITLKFTKPGTVVVRQSGASFDCGFGNNVFALGTYIKISGRKPKFEAVDR
jgi:hypothetical protein